MCSDGPGSSGQTGYTDTDGQFKLSFANEDVRFVCPKCGNSYAYRKNLKAHMDEMHNNIYRYRCETCGKGFTGRSRYQDHVAAHTGVRRHTCSICEANFTNRGTLKMHVLRCHPNEAADIL